MIAWVWPELTVRSTPLRISAVSVSPPPTVTCRSRISSVLIGRPRCARPATRVLLYSMIRSQARSCGVLLWCEAQPGLDGGHDLLLEVGDADAVHHVGEEAAHDQAARLLGVDPPALQVEQLQ